MGGHMRSWPVRLLGFGVAGAVLCLVSVVAVAPSALAKGKHHPPPEVLYVGDFDGVVPSTGDYATIQEAVNAAEPGDWILIAPGDYHEDDDATIKAPNFNTAHGWYGGVLIKTSDITLMGMNRDQVIVD
ncbi:MAG TPA: hypothetical protein VK386_03350, partial [Acidimicrobiales bacterium]|nr:hypothetical protein [Acidimicrobiales bacterium]